MSAYPRLAANAAYGKDRKTADVLSRLADGSMILLDGETLYRAEPIGTLARKV